MVDLDVQRCIVVGLCGQRWIASRSNAVDLDGTQGEQIKLKGRSYIGKKSRDVVFGGCAEVPVAIK